MRVTALLQRAQAKKPDKRASCLLAVALLACGCGGDSEVTSAVGAAAGTPKAAVAEATKAVERVVASAAGALGLAGNSTPVRVTSEKKATSAPVAPRRRIRRAKRAPDVTRQLASPISGDTNGPLPAPEATLALESMPHPAVQPREAPDVEVRAQDSLYSSADSDVEPPVWRAKTVSAAQLAADAATIPALELIVAADGSTERARLLSRPRLLTDMMILSGAKMWKFEPALRAGVPVRYRMIVRWH